MSRRGWLLFVTMGVIWGVPYLLIKIADRQIAPPMLVEMRTGGAALILVPIALARGEVAPVLRRWRAVIVFSLAEIMVPWVLLFSAERRLSSSLAGLLVAAVPLLSAALAQLTGGSDAVDRRRLVGILVGLGGVAALVGFDVHGSSAWAAVSLGGVVVGYALGPFVLSRYLTGLPGLGVMAVSLTICAVAYAPIAAFDVPTVPLAPTVIASVVGLTLLCTAAAFVIFFALIAEVGPVRSTMITYVNPAVAVVLGVSVLNEPFGWGTGLGFVLIIAGCVMAAGTGRPGAAPGTIAGRDGPGTKAAGPGEPGPGLSRRA